MIILLLTFDLLEILQAFIRRKCSKIVALSKFTPNKIYTESSCSKTLSYILYIYSPKYQVSLIAKASYYWIRYLRFENSIWCFDLMIKNKNHKICVYFVCNRAACNKNCYSRSINNNLPLYLLWNYCKNVMDVTFLILKI